MAFGKAVHLLAEAEVSHDVVQHFSILAQGGSRLLEEIICSYVIKIQ